MFNGEHDSVGLEVEYKILFFITHAYSHTTGVSSGIWEELI